MNNNKNFDFTNKKSPTSLNSLQFLPWYKKKGNIIAMSLVLGVGVLSTAITVPTLLIGRQITYIPQVLPPPTNTTLISPNEYFSIGFNEEEIKKTPINDVTRLLIWENMIFPDNLPFTKNQLDISNLIKNIDLNFVSFSLSSNFSDQFVTKTIFYQVTLDTDKSAEHMLNNELIPRWNSLPAGQKYVRWDFLNYPFVSQPEPTIPNEIVSETTSYRQNFSFNSLFFYLTGDLRFNSQVYNYAKVNIPESGKESYTIQRNFKGGSFVDMVRGDKTREFAHLESYYTIVEKNNPANFIIKLPWKIEYHFNQSLSIRNVTNNQLKRDLWEITFPPNSIRMVVKEFADVTDPNSDILTTPAGYSDLFNTKSIVLRTSPNLLLRDSSISKY